MCVLLLSETSCPFLTLRLHGYHGHHVLKYTHSLLNLSSTISHRLTEIDLHVLSISQQVCVSKHPSTRQIFILSHRDTQHVFIFTPSPFRFFFLSVLAFDCYLLLLCNIPIIQYNLNISLLLHIGLIDFKGTLYPKKYNSVVIFSTSCCSCITYFLKFNTHTQRQ